MAGLSGSSRPSSSSRASDWRRHREETGQELVGVWTTVAILTATGGSHRRMFLWGFWLRMQCRGRQAATSITADSWLTIVHLYTLRSHVFLRLACCRTGAGTTISKYNFLER